MSDILEELTATRRRDAALREAEVPFAEMMRRAEGTAAPLKDLLEFAHGLGLSALVETHDEEEIERAVQVGARIVGVNCRNLRNFSTDVSLLESLVGRIPRPCVRIAESGMHTAEAIRRAKAAGADGFLVGTALMRAERPGEKLREMIEG